MLHSAKRKLSSPTSPCELSEREVTSPFNLKVVRAMNYKYSKVINNESLQKSMFDLICSVFFIHNYTVPKGYKALYIVYI
jgi:hypothetical protein